MHEHPEMPFGDPKLGADGRRVVALQFPHHECLALHRRQALATAQDQRDEFGLAAGLFGLGAHAGQPAPGAADEPVGSAGARLRQVVAGRHFARLLAKLVDELVSKHAIDPCRRLRCGREAGLRLEGRHHGFGDGILRHRTVPQPGPGESQKTWMQGVQVRNKGSTTDWTRDNRNCCRGMHAPNVGGAWM